MSRVLHGFAESVAPTLKKSELTTRGVLTPAEFVAAGDALVSKFPSWTWAVGESSQRRSYLPSDKQYLVTKSGAWQEGRRGVGEGGARRAARQGTRARMRSAVPGTRQGPDERGGERV